MTIAEILLLDFDAEVQNTRRTLERLPNDRGDWKPHEKSMAMGRLAVHVARLPHFGEDILSTDSMNLATVTFPPLIWEGQAKALELLEATTSSLRTRLSSMSDDELTTVWSMSFGEQLIASAPRVQLYRTLFFNHLLHHRAQLGVYLRLLNEKVPGLYGPSADEPLGG
ncbi:MAG TPA: DinB family protein [Acidobacteriaceae bacterium]|jgi:uncharacterized damage-inducible protein DinB|nr:DinB family protein [Acidobacteriaceae bacterium]